MYHPIFYWMRQYLPMLREEYRPISVFINYFKSRAQQNQKLMSREALDSLEGRNVTPKLSQKAIQRTVDIQSKPLSEKDAKDMKQEADLIKNEIAEIKKNTGAKVVLFDIRSSRKLMLHSGSNKSENWRKSCFRPIVLSGCRPRKSESGAPMMPST